MVFIVFDEFVKFVFFGVVFEFMIRSNNCIEIEGISDLNNCFFDFMCVLDNLKVFVVVEFFIIKFDSSVVRVISNFMFMFLINFNVVLLEIESSEV